MIKVTDLESGDYFGFFWIGPKGEPFLGVVPGLDHGNDPRIISAGLLKEPDIQGSLDRTRNCGPQKRTFHFY